MYIYTDMTNLPYFCSVLESKSDNRKRIATNEIMKLLNGDKPLFEWLNGDESYKPYFDVDKYIIDGTLEKETDTCVNNSMQAITTMFKSNFDITLLENDFAIETNSRPIKHKKKGIEYNGKISIHIVLPKYKIKGTYLKEVLIASKNADNCGGLFDIGVYGSVNQKFRVSGFRKKAGDPKPKISNSIPFTDYLISRVSDDLINIEDAPISMPKKIENPKYSKTDVSKLLDRIGAVDEYDNWIKISAAIKNISPDFKDIWRDWSMLASNYNEIDNNSKWESFKPGNSGIGTLNHYANLTKPPSISSSELDTLISDRTQQSASNLFCSLYVKYIKCIDQEKGIYMLYDHDKCIWAYKTINGIYNEVSNIIQDALIVKLDEYNGQSETTSSCSEKEDIEEKIANILALRKNLSTASFVSGINKFIAGNNTIYDADFRMKTTEKKDILSVKNGIVELRTGKLRPRQYDDYQIEFIDMDYIEDVESLEWEEFLKDIFDHPNIKDPETMLSYIHKLFGYLITKETSAQVMTICNGTGGNGKSVVTNIMQKIFKNNMAKVDESLIDKSQKSNANAASPEKAKLYNKSTAFIEETEDDTELGKVFKQLVDGGDSVARELYGNPFTFENTAKLVMNTNILPSFKSSDAFLRRIIVIQYFNSYVHKEDVRPGDKIRDDNIESTLLNNKAGIMSWFVKGAMRFYSEGKLGDIPVEMQAAKKDLKSANDWSSNLVFTNDMTDKMTNAEILEHIETQSSMKVSAKDIKKTVESMGAKAYKSNGVRGYKGIKSTILCKNEIIEDDQCDPLDGY